MNLLFNSKNNIVTREYIYKNSKIKSGLNGFKIINISDLHSRNFKNYLNEKIEQLKPDIIVVTGDIIHRGDSDFKTVIDFMKNAVKIAPVYYVRGNHEAGNDYSFYLSEKFRNLGAVILDGASVEICKNGCSFNLIGLQCYQYYEYTSEKENNAMWEDLKNTIAANIKPDKLNVLLSHRPYFDELFVNSDIDLALCGHTHAGQIRFPFIGALFAPDQGFFPKYDRGFYSNGKNSMIISSGLGASDIELRVLNRPEITSVILSNV